MPEPSTAEEWLQLAKDEREAATLLLGHASLRRVVFGHIGFSIEYTLKAALQRKFRYNQWPSKLRTHDLSKLLSELGVTVTANHPIAPAWATIGQWRRGDLYDPATFSKAVIDGMFEAAFGKEGIEQWTHQTFL